MHTQLLAESVRLALSCNVPSSRTHIADGLLSQWETGPEPRLLRAPVHQHRGHDVGEGKPEAVRLQLVSDGRPTRLGWLAVRADARRLPSTAPGGTETPFRCGSPMERSSSGSGNAGATPSSTRPEAVAGLGDAFLHLRLTPELAKRLRRVASSRRIPVAELVRQLLDAGLP